jgi:tRNA pseudouridine13 synthase
LPGTGGELKRAPEDFCVEELPAYLPSGEGAHTFVFIEKRGLTTEEALTRLCRALAVPRDAAGSAGMKDRHAVTRQWLSFPDVDPAAALAFSTPELRVLEAARHGNKLKTGHLRGNRFALALRGVTCTQAEAIARATAVLAAMATSGMPNYFGAQRFGARGDNAARGRALLEDGARGGRRIPRGERRLLISALQSELFNAYLDARLADASVRRALLGDIVRRRDSGGLFDADEATLADAQARLDAGALDVTGPMFGSKMRAPAAASPAAVREAQILEAAQLSREAFAKAGSIAEGTRRPLTVPVGEVEVRAGDAPDAIRLSFTLPPGAYATVLIGEVAKP